MGVGFGCALGFSGLGLRVQSFGLRVQGFGLRAQRFLSLGFKVFRVEVVGFKACRAQENHACGIRRQAKRILITCTPPQKGDPNI